MWINKIKINNFRNYKNEEIDLEKNINIFYGENAQGKTNIIEAIFLSSMGKSFRAKKDLEMIQLGKENANIEFIGAAATLVFEEYEKNNMLNNMIVDVAKLLMSAILDNTLNFTAKVTSNRDKRAYQKMQEIIEINDFDKCYFYECQKQIEENLDEYRNIALFGIDSRDSSLGKGNRSDCIIIAC